MDPAPFRETLVAATPPGDLRLGYIAELQRTPVIEPEPNYLQGEGFHT